MDLLGKLIELGHRDFKVALSGISFLIFVQLDLKIGSKWEKLIPSSKRYGLIAFGHKMMVHCIIGLNS